MGMHQMLLGAAGGGGVALEFLGEQYRGVDGTSYSIDADLGDPDPNRHIIVAIAGVRENTTSGLVSSVSIGGVSATLHRNSNETSGNQRACSCIASAIVPNGSGLQTISVTFTNQQNKMMWSFYKGIRKNTNITPFEALGRLTGGEFTPAMAGFGTGNYGVMTGAKGVGDGTGTIILFTDGGAADVARQQTTIVCTSGRMDGTDRVAYDFGTQEGIINAVSWAP